MTPTMSCACDPGSMKMMTPQKKTLKVSYQVTPEEVRIEVEDQGSGFDPDAVPDPTEDVNLEIPSGRGIMLIRAYMTEVRFHPPGNRMEMVFRPGA